MGASACYPVREWSYTSTKTPNLIVGYSASSVLYLLAMTEHHNKYSTQYKVTLMLWLCFSAMTLSMEKDTYSYVRFSSPVNGDR
jgi:hypothetical protein